MALLGDAESSGIDSTMDDQSAMQSNKQYSTYLTNAAKMDPVAYCDLKRAFDRAVRTGDLGVMRSCYATCQRVARDEDRRTGLTPLVAAVQPDALSIGDNVGVLQVLIGEFCSPISDPSSGRYGNNILHWLVLYHRVSLLEWALNQDFCQSDIVNSLNNDGHSPLHLAVHTSQSALYAALLHHGASPNIMGAGGNTALHVATQHLDFVCTQLLVARGADLNARNAAGETPLMTLFLPYVDTGFRLSSSIQHSTAGGGGGGASSSTEKRERCLIMPILEFLVIKGADVRLEAPCRLDITSGNNVLSNSVELTSPTSSLDNVPTSISSLVLSSARQIAFHYGFVRAAERLASEEKSLLQFEWLQRPVDVDPFRPFVVLICESDEDVARVFEGLKFDECCGNEVVFDNARGGKKSSPSSSSASSASASTFLSAQREEIVDGIFNMASSKLIQGALRWGEGGSKVGGVEVKDEDSVLDDGVTHVVTMRYSSRDETDNDVCCSKNSNNNNNIGVNNVNRGSSTLSSDSFVVDCLTRRSAMTPHLLRALAISVPPLIIYSFKRPESDAGGETRIAEEIRRKITQIAEAASLKSPLPLLKTSVLICMLDSEGGLDEDNRDDSSMPPEVTLFNVIEKTKNHFLPSPSLNGPFPSDIVVDSRADDSSVGSSVLQVDFLHNFENGASADDLFVLSSSLSSSTSWTNLRAKLVSHRRHLVQSLPTMTNLGREILRDTESMILPPNYESFDDILDFVGGHLHPLLTEGMLLETLKTMEIRGEALFLEDEGVATLEDSTSVESSKAEDSSNGDDVNSNLKEYGNTSKNAPSTEPSPVSVSTVLISPFTGLNSNRLCLGSGCKTSSSSAALHPTSAALHPTSANASKADFKGCAGNGGISRSGTANGKPFVDLSALLSAGVASSYVLQRIFAKESSLSFNIRLHPSLDDFEWKFDDDSGMAVTTTKTTMIRTMTATQASAMAPLSRVYSLVDKTTNSRKGINPLLIPLLCSALSSRSINQAHSTSSLAASPPSVISKLSGNVAWVQDTLSMSESCFVLSKDFSSLIILTRSLSSSSAPSITMASAYEKFKSDINYCVNLCLDTLHESKIEWSPLPLSRKRSNVLRLSELESLIE